MEAQEVALEALPREVHVEGVARALVLDVARELVEHVAHRESLGPPAQVLQEDGGLPLVHANLEQVSGEPDGPLPLIDEPGPHESVGSSHPGTSPNACS